VRDGMSPLLDAAEAGGSLFADVSWVAVMAVASLLGGQLGIVPRPAPQRPGLRWLVIAFGIAIGVRLLLVG
jgi:uncharacterized membrane protein YfcA